MNKKDIKFIMGCLVVAVLGFAIYMIYAKMNVKDKIFVEYKNEVIKTLDLSQDDFFTFEGSYGTMNLEVKDGRYRVVDVECPNHNCEQMGWHDKESLTPITCLPNEVIIYSVSDE